MDFIRYFDDKILNGLYVITQFSIALVFISVYFVYRKKYIAEIVLASIINSIGLLLIMLRGFVPDIISIWFGNSIVIWSTCIIYDVLIQVIGRKSSRKKSAYFTIAFALLHFYLTFIYPSLTYRIINFSVFIGIATLYLCFIYFRHLLKRFDLSLFIIAITHFFYCLLLIVRIFDAFNFNKDMELFSNTSVLKYFILFTIFHSIIRAVCILVYHTEDLVHPN